VRGVGHAESSAAACPSARDTIALDAGRMALHLVSAARDRLGDAITDATTFSGQLAYRLTDTGAGLLIGSGRPPAQIRRLIGYLLAKL